MIAIWGEAAWQQLEDPFDPQNWLFEPNNPIQRSHFYLNVCLVDFERGHTFDEDLISENGNLIL